MDGRRRALERGARFSTRRRLTVAFSCVLAALVSAFAVQIVALRRMEATFAEMKEHEEQMHLALALEDAVRDQYGHEARYLMGEVTRLEDYEAARARSLETMQRLSAHLDEPAALAWIEEVRAASEELDRMFRADVAAGIHGPDARTPRTLDQSYRLLLLIEGSVDKVFRMLEQAISSVRHDLVALERTAMRWTAALLVVTPLFVVGAVLYLSRSVAQPLARLSDGAAALAAGDLDTRIDIDTPDEFGALAAEFNAMTVALKRNQRQLVESEKLAGIGRLAAGVAHELNNPLQVMIGYLSLHRDVADRRLAARLATIEEEALRCKGIVDGLLELSRPTVTPGAVDLRELCDDVASGLRATSRTDAPRMSVEGAGHALGDGPRLRQVVFNLMKNAVEAAGAAGDVRVRIGTADGGVAVVVSDTGPGIAPEARPRLFEPFFTTKPSGTGLGLSVSRAIALAHGGDIEIGCPDSGGAVFTLRLPEARGRHLA